ncbi:MAG: WcaF family extracellular polysaccharide biosynthesis acetyltransferase [Bacteroidales bacterium]|nr:WcaF family extracellular polysaccharide biosynthesis acetyltransferase [Bacteroidales bacterium]
MTHVKLNTFSTGNYEKGASLVKRTLWYFVNALFVRASWNPFAAPKIFLLKLFGAKIGARMVIKNNVIVKSPWNLVAGDDVWIGEGVWIDNLDRVAIGNDVCLSQGAMLLTGNHDYKSSSFDYRNAPITIEDGAWIGAKSVVCPGVTVMSHAILTVGSVATKNMEAWGIYQGNPAVKIRERVIE